MNAELATNALNVSKVLKALAHPARLKVLCALITGERTVSELVKYSNESQSFVSQLLARMRLEGLIESRKEGAYVHYCIADTRLIDLMKSIESIYCKTKKGKQHV